MKKTFEEFMSPIVVSPRLNFYGLAYYELYLLELTPIDTFLIPNNLTKHSVDGKLREATWRSIFHGEP